MQEQHTTLLSRVAKLSDASPPQKVQTLKELSIFLESETTNQARSGDVLANEEAMAALIRLCQAAAMAPGIVLEVLGILKKLAKDPANANEMMTCHPSSLKLLMDKVKFGKEDVKIEALQILLLLASHDENGKEMVTKQPTLLDFLKERVEYGTDNIQLMALAVLANLASHPANKREMVTKHSALITLILIQMDSMLETTQGQALRLMYSLLKDPQHMREMVVNHPTLPIFFMDQVGGEEELKAMVALSYMVDHVNKSEATIDYSRVLEALMHKVKTGTEVVQDEALVALGNFSHNPESAREMVTNDDALLPLLLKKMRGVTLLSTMNVIYGLSCTAANRDVIRQNDGLVKALIEARTNQHKNVAVLSLLTLVNLFGAMEDSTSVLKTDEGMLSHIVLALDRAMKKKGGWRLEQPLRAFRYLTVVQHNSKLLWSLFQDRFLTKVLDALKQAINQKNEEAVDYAVSTLAQFSSYVTEAKGDNSKPGHFSSDAESLLWIRANKSKLDQPIANLQAQQAMFPEAYKSAQLLKLSLDPPKVVKEPPASSSGITVMISYNWAHQAFARRIDASLKALGYQVWRDETHMKGNIIDAMADGVSKSSVVLALVTRAYKESAFCKMECQFAFQSERKVVPVLVEPEYVFKGDGWLGLLLGSLDYYDVSMANDTELQAKMSELAEKEIGEVTKETVAAPLVGKEKKPVPQNEQEIRAWLAAAVKGGEGIADMLIKEGITSEGLEMLAKQSTGDLKILLNVNGMQAMYLENALKELFGRG